MATRYDVAAYVWPAYHDDVRARIFFPAGLGEWEIILNSRPKFAGHKQPRKPLWGYVNEADPRVMEMQIDAAADNGVTTFIYDWYWYDRRPFLEDALNEGYLKARNNARVKFYLMWANHDASTMWDLRNSHDKQCIWQAAIDRAEFERVCTRLVERYFGHPSYYQIDGKPVFSIYNLTSLITGLGGIDETQAGLDWFRDQASAAGLGGLHLQAILQKKVAAEIAGLPEGGELALPEVIDKLGLDSLTHYQWCHIAQPKGDYTALGDTAVTEWENIAAHYRVPYFPHVTVGWDNNPRLIELSENIITGNDPDKFEHFLRLAKKFADARQSQLPLITVNSWNEWSESSYIQPDTEHGYGYLEAIRNVFIDGSTSGG